MNQAGRKQLATLISLGAFVPLYAGAGLAVYQLYKRGHLRGEDAKPLIALRLCTLVMM